MTRQTSFTRLEQSILPGFRDRMERAESTEDVRKFFAETAASLLSDALGRPGAVRSMDVRLTPGQGEGYAVERNVMESPVFQETWQDSDLGRILADLARGAANRFAHLDKHPEKTEAKMFHHKQGKR